MWVGRLSLLAREGSEGTRHVSRLAPGHQTLAAALPPAAAAPARRSAPPMAPSTTPGLCRPGICVSAWTERSYFALISVYLSDVALASITETQNPLQEIVCLRPFPAERVSPPPARLSADLNDHSAFDLRGILRSSCASLRTGDTDHDRIAPCPLSTLTKKISAVPPRVKRDTEPRPRDGSAPPRRPCRLARLRWPAPPSGCIGSSAEPSAIGVVWPHCPGEKRGMPPARAGRPRADRLTRRHQLGCSGDRRFSSAGSAASSPTGS